MAKRINSLREINGKGEHIITWRVTSSRYWLSIKRRIVITTNKGKYEITL